MARLARIQRIALASANHALRCMPIQKNAERSGHDSGRESYWQRYAEDLDSVKSSQKPLGRSYLRTGIFYRGLGWADFAEHPPAIEERCIATFFTIYSLNALRQCPGHADLHFNDSQLRMRAARTFALRYPLSASRGDPAPAVSSVPFIWWLCEKLIVVSIVRGKSINPSRRVQFARCLEKAKMIYVSRKCWIRGNRHRPSRSARLPP